MRTPVTSLRRDSSLGKRPTTRVRFLIWPLMFSQALDVRRRFLWASGRANTVKPSGCFSYHPTARISGLIERLWKLTKRRCLTNRYYADFSAFCEAIDNCLDNLPGPLNEELTSLMALNFQFFQNHKS